MDRHHLLTLLDQLQEKYQIQDGEYKEFAEAIGGKKKLLEINEGDLIKVEYTHIETEVDFCDDEFYPKMNIIEKCSRIWKVIPDEDNYHLRDMVSYVYLNRTDMRLAVINKIMKDHSEGNFTMMSFDTDTQRKHCIKVSSITKP